MSVKKTNKGLSVDELKALQLKAGNGEGLSDEEKSSLAATEKEAEAIERAAEQEEQLEKIASLIAKKMKDSAVEGGKPFVPSADDAAKAKAKSQEQVADEYYKAVDLDNFTWPGIHVTSDNQIFIGNVQGENALSNHKKTDEKITHKSFAKPTSKPE